MSVLGIVHIACGLCALSAGAAVLLRPKGTRSHRFLGWCYVASMTGLLATAFGIYRLFHGFGPFHVAALFALGTLIGGVLPAWRKHPADRWVSHHYYWMTNSYLGLAAATAAEITVRVPGTIFWPSVIGATVAVALLGGRLIRRRAAATIARATVAARHPRPAVGGADATSPAG